MHPQGLARWSTRCRQNCFLAFAKAGTIEQNMQTKHVFACTTAGVMEHTMHTKLFILRSQKLARWNTGCKQNRFLHSRRLTRWSTRCRQNRFCCVRKGWRDGKHDANKIGFCIHNGWRDGAHDADKMILYDASVGGPFEINNKSAYFVGLGVGGTQHMQCFARLGLSRHNSATLISPPKFQKAVNAILCWDGPPGHTVSSSTHAAV